ncbi:MAG: DUF294 nucleotidyltransferase-like domain-containing protein, partial [Myxococcales bacterium]|nr:DUF294 nucleotidyltransferase-like domain-containing protein [Myxococcales bacterium]
MKVPSIDAFLPPGRGAARGTADLETVSGAVRRYLEEVREHLGALHRSGGSGRLVNETHSNLLDRLVRRLFQLSEEAFFSDRGGDVSELCVIAVGGYARREMSIHSDVDLLFLFRGELTSHVAAVTERVQYWLWDAQVTVGGATRTIDETIALARE